MKQKTFFTAFGGLSFGEKIKIWQKIADTSFKQNGWKKWNTNGKKIRSKTKKLKNIPQCDPILHSLP